MATFHMDVAEAQRLIEELQAQVGDGGPCDTERGKHEIGED